MKVEGCGILIATAIRSDRLAYFFRIYASKLVVDSEISVVSLLDLVAVDLRAAI